MPMGGKKHSQIQNPTYADSFAPKVYDPFSVPPSVYATTFILLEFVLVISTISPTKLLSP